MMAAQEMKDKLVDTDVLVVGGGIAGCPTAYKAAEKGLRVTLIEKSKTERSGHAGAGIDTLLGWPLLDVPLPKQVKNWEGRVEWINGKGRFCDANIPYTIYKGAYWALEEAEKMGLDMTWHNGQIHWNRNRFWEDQERQMCVHWMDVKPQMARAVHKKGVEVLDRVMLVDLLTNKGRVVGATAVNTRTGQFLVIKAKAVVVASGPLARSYDPEQPLFYKYKMKYHGAPGAIAGDGLAAGYRAGAELANLDVGNCWGFRLRDEITVPYGQMVHRDGISGRWRTWDGMMIPFLTAPLYTKLERMGRDPIYVDTIHFPEDYQARCEVALADERLVSLMACAQRGFDPHTHRWELMVNMPHNFTTICGLVIDETFQTTLKGLFAVGDAASGLASCGPGIQSAFLCADGLPAAVSEASEPVLDEGQVESQKKSAFAPLTVKDGTEPMEFECAVRWINSRYVGEFKSEGKIREGLKRLDSLKRRFLPELMATNPHYLMRCLEARNLLELTELHLRGCLERKESRGNYMRTDYPETDPARDDMVTYQSLRNGKPVLDIRRPPALKPEYAEEAN